VDVTVIGWGSVEDTRMTERQFHAGDRVRDPMHDPGTVMGWDLAEYLDSRFDSGRRDCAWVKRLGSLAEAPADDRIEETEWPGTDGLAHLVAILEELRVVLLAIDAETVDRRYVDSGRWRAGWKNVLPGCRSSKELTWRSDDTKKEGRPEAPNAWPLLVTGTKRSRNGPVRSRVALRRCIVVALCQSHSHHWSRVRNRPTIGETRPIPHLPVRPEDIG
jgi:hypothetical protein